MASYSFLSVNASITGPGGSFSLGAGAAPAEEGITIEMIEEKDAPAWGADGSLMHSLRAANGGRVTVRLQKTSPVNALLSAMYNFQRLTPAGWGSNVILISDVHRGDVITVSQASFMRQPQLAYGKDAGNNEWVFVGNVDEALGIGTPEAA